MKIHQKFCGKRYYIYARREDCKNWTDWTQTNDVDVAMKQVENIRGVGFWAKLKDRELNEVLIEDGSEKVS